MQQMECIREASSCSCLLCSSTSCFSESSFNFRRPSNKLNMIHNLNKACLLLGCY
ncbi:hypothetical protein PO909_030226 [Leuciscus waleckii]